ncbi:MAG: D-glycero-beta-D-manno-heptose 1,7-bisphosphate 7-phosphatase [Chlamydiota bacterium]
MKPAAVFLDRDGTLNHDPGYLGDAEMFRFLPGVIDALKRLKDAGYLIFVVSNQSGIARGFFGVDELRRIHDRMAAGLREGGVTLDGIYYCPHHPDAQCPCRKPSPRMVLDAAERYAVDLGRSYFIGDRISDVETGNNAGCGTVLVLTGAGKEARAALKADRLPDHVAADLSAAADWILSRETT